MYCVHVCTSKLPSKRWVFRKWRDCLLLHCKYTHPFTYCENCWHIHNVHVKLCVTGFWKSVLSLFNLLTFQPFCPSSITNVVGFLYLFNSINYYYYVIIILLTIMYNYVLINSKFSIVWIVCSKLLIKLIF